MKLYHLEVDTVEISGTKRVRVMVPEPFADEEVEVYDIPLCIYLASPV